MKDMMWHDPAKADEFGPGPWMDEPDKIQWTDKATGYPCLIVRGPLGALCGYGGVTKAHPFYKRPYDEVDGGISVHGGLTYSDTCQTHAPEGAGICHIGICHIGICHIVEPGEDDDVWWFGFDCAHGYDYIPGMGIEGLRDFNDDSDVYRDIAYVQAECVSLAAQLKAKV